MALKEIAQIDPTALPSSERQSRELSATLPADLRPIDPRELAVRLAHTLAPWPDAAPELMSQYRQVLADVPADLVEIALDHVLKTCGTYVPKPAQLREPIAKQLEDRRRHHRAMVDGERRKADAERQVAERERWRATGYDPDAEIRERAMAEIRAIKTPEMRSRESIPRIDSPGANYRRALLREAFARHVAAHSPSPTPAQPEEAATP